MPQQPFDDNADDKALSSAKLDRLRRRITRERTARRRAEHLLEEKSLELYQTNTSLRQANASLSAALDEAKKTTAQNKRLAQYDPLTSLPNRRRLFDWLAVAGRPAKGARAASLGVINVDLDRFKQINDTMGHAAGDAVLKAAAATLRKLAKQLAPASSSRRGDPQPIVARLGGDEFILAGLLRASPDKAEQVFSSLASQITAELRELEIDRERPVRVGASAGVAVRSVARGLGEPGDILAEADLALYRAKGGGRGRSSAFTPQMRAEAVARRRLSDEIMSGLAQDAFEPFFQPQVDAKSFEIVGAEALARWRRPSGEVWAPSQFLTNASELGVLPSIDRAIMRQAREALENWRADGLGPIGVSVNVSAGRLQDPSMLEDIADGSKPPVSFELVETVLLDELDEATRFTLDTLMDAGVNVEIDDFGSGHASIVGLMRIRPHRIKLDRGLIAPIIECAEHRKVVGGMVEMAKAIGVAVTAEGVETMEQAHLLREMGCDLLQGYAFAEPLSRWAFADRLRAQEKLSTGKRAGLLKP